MIGIEYDLVEKDDWQNEDGYFEYNDHEFGLLSFYTSHVSYKQLSINLNRKVNL